MQLSKKFVGGIVFLIIALAPSNTKAIEEADKDISLSSMIVTGVVDFETDSHRKEKMRISLYFTLGSETNGIIPMQENIEIGFGSASMVGAQRQCLIIFIPAYSFVDENHWYEVYETSNPAGVGIKVLLVNEATGELIKDLSDTLKLFDAILTPIGEKNHYYLLIEAIFEHEDTNLMSLAFLGSSTQTVLILGDDSGSTFARSVSFKHP